MFSCQFGHMISFFVRSRPRSYPLDFPSPLTWANVQQTTGLGQRGPSSPSPFNFPIAASFSVSRSKRSRNQNADFIAWPDMHAAACLEAE